MADRGEDQVEATRVDAGERRRRRAPQSRRLGSDMRRVFDALPAMIGYWDTDLRNVFANRAYLDFFGMEPSEIRGRHARELLGHKLFAEIRPYVERVLAGAPQQFNATIVDPTGTPRHVQTSMVPDVVREQVRGYAVLVTDLTDRTVSDQQRAAAEARFRLAFSASPVGMGMIDTNGVIVECNRALCRMLGFRERELLGLSFADFIAPERREGARAQAARLFAGKSSSSSAELPALRKDGSRIWVILSYSVTRSKDGEPPLAIGHVQDISARKQAEDELARSRQRLVEAEKVARMGSFEWDLRSHRATWSDGMFEIYGLAPEAFEPALEGGENRVLPDDWPLVRETIERAVAERGSFSMEYRALRTDGRVRILRSRGEVVVDEAGEPVRILGIAQDITEAKLYEDALKNDAADLQRRAAELQRLALRSAPDRRGTPQAPLTPRQLEILRLVAQGKTSGEIAQELFVSEGTVKWHVKQILAKTRSSSRAEAVARVLGSNPHG